MCIRDRAESFGGVGLRVSKPEELDAVIKEMIGIDQPVVVDVRVDPAENCFPMIPSGAAHNEMIFGPEDKPDTVSEQAMSLI